jgi:hypothetical protein
MARKNVLKWMDGSGWIVLSGGAAVESEIRARVLHRATAEGGVAYISVNSPEGSEALNDMNELGAPTGYLVDVLAEDDPIIQTSLGEASVIVVEDSASPEALRSGLVGAAISGMKTALDRGAIILAEGAGASVLGAWIVLDSGRLVSGLEWIEDAIVIPGISGLSDSAQTRTALENHPNAIAIGIALQLALALTQWRDRNLGEWASRSRWDVYRERGVNPWNRP